MADATQKPLELILARNLMSALSTPAFLVDEGGILVFYNEAAGSLLGKSFEESGKMEWQEWGTAFGPFDENGDPLPYDDIPLTIAVRQGRPAHATFRIRAVDGTEHDIEASALPIMTGEGSRGAIVSFWPTDSAWTTDGDGAAE